MCRFEFLQLGTFSQLLRVLMLLGEFFQPGHDGALWVVCLCWLPPWSWIHSSSSSNHLGIKGVAE
ncbi:hypothetical protein U1Q18_005948 [Sarracenia purpurea var. burkii]